MANGLL